MCYAIYITTPVEVLSECLDKIEHTIKLTNTKLIPQAKKSKTKIWQGVVL